MDPTNKGFDIRAFRIKQAAKREKDNRKGAGCSGLGQFNSDDTFGVKMENMALDKQIVIDSERLMQNMNDQEAIKRDEEEAMQKRTNFSFGGQSVRDRIKKRKSNAKIGNEVTKLERIIMSKKKEGEEENDD